VSGVSVERHPAGRAGLSGWPAPGVGGASHDADGLIGGLAAEAPARVEGRLSSITHFRRDRQWPPTTF
jgi:hypothetical protein